MSVVVGQQPTKHNYFNQEDFYRYDYKSGTAQTFNAQRVFHASEDFIVGLQHSVEQVPTDI